jgi:hypothetical protein
LTFARISVLYLFLMPHAPPPLDTTPADPAEERAARQARVLQRLTLALEARVAEAPPPPEAVAGRARHDPRGGGTRRLIARCAQPRSAGRRGRRRSHGSGPAALTWSLE